MTLPKLLQEKRDELVEKHNEVLRYFNNASFDSVYKNGFNACADLLLPEIEKMREVLQHYSNEHENALWWPGVNRPGVEQNYGKYADQALAHIEEFLNETK